MFRSLSVDDFDAAEALFLDIEPGLQSPGDGVIDRVSEAELQKCFAFPVEHRLAERCFFLMRLRGGVGTGTGFQRLYDRQMGSIFVCDAAVDFCAGPEFVGELVTEETAAAAMKVVASGERGAVIEFRRHRQRDREGNCPAEASDGAGDPGPVGHPALALGGAPIQNSDYSDAHERLVRASGNPYTIVRPGWFDYNQPDQQKIVRLQGDRRESGSPADGVIARDQIARVLIDSLHIDAADHKTFELVADRGPEQEDLTTAFTSLTPDSNEFLEGAEDLVDFPVDDEPETFRRDLIMVAARNP